MNVMISGEHYDAVTKKETETAKQMQMIRAIEKDCTAFNVAKKEVFDSLNATIEALKNNCDCDVLLIESEAALWSILMAKDSLDVLFATVLKAGGLLT